VRAGDATHLLMSTERSQSRGRDVQYQSTGRGGAGNFKRSESVSRDAVQRDVDGDERGREIFNHPGAPTHSGRGGAGNVRSPSRDPAVRAAELEAIKHEKDVIEATKALEKTQIHSSGRGGFGNMTVTTPPTTSPSRPASTSRSRSRDPGFISSGRGGAGNIRSESRDTRGDLARLDEEERKAHVHKDDVHSTGRGGWANITHRETPHEPHNTNVPHDEHHGAGRGGIGNIHQAQLFDANKRDPSKERGRPTERHEVPHPHVPGIVEGLWNKVSGKE